MTNVAILGASGSIGTQTLEVIETLPDVRVAGLTVHTNTKVLEAQVRKFHPDCVCVADEARAADFRVRVADTGVKVLSGPEGVEEIAALPQADIVVTAMVGIAGLRPTVRAIKAGKRIALANKETLVTAGPLVMALAKEYGAVILPVDSEHSAVFQCLQSRAGGEERVKQILLTASGGPFFGKTRAELAAVTRGQALRHPNWDMGAKITVDSATMMNKGLEVIEASHLFGVPVDDVHVVVHRQSVVHSMVAFSDNAVLAQMGVPDMKLPIQYALTYPDRRPMAGNELDLAAYGSLTFEPPDLDTFGCLRLAYHAGRVGGSLPCVLNAANEVCVDWFLQEKIGFLEIEQLVEQQMAAHAVLPHPTLLDILELDNEVRQRMRRADR